MQRNDKAGNNLKSIGNKAESNKAENRQGSS